MRTTEGRLFDQHSNSNTNPSQMNRYNQKMHVMVMAAVAATLSAQAADPVAIPASYAQPASALDTSAPGFRVRTVQASNANGTVENSVARAESQLAGTLVNATTSQLYTNIVDLSVFGADGYYNETSVIDYDKAGGSGSGLYIPGVPGTIEPENTDNIALEALTYISLQPGTYSMVVNSDDGFQLTASPDPRDHFTTTLIGEFDGGRGAADSVMTFSVSAAGVYGFRLVYFQGGSDGKVTWSSALVSDSTVQTLINAADSGALKAYRKLTTASAPYVDIANPAPNSTGNGPKPAFKYRIVDGASFTVAASTVQLYLNGQKVAATVAKDGAKTTVTFAQPTMLESLSTNSVKLVYGDSSATPVYLTNDLKFMVVEYPSLTLPAPIYLETFDSFPEQTTAPDEYNQGLYKWNYHGWTSESYTDERTAGWDLNDPNSDAYRGWVVMSKDRVLAITSWEGPRRVSNVAEAYVNGEKVTTLASNNFFYAESDQRGGSQVQFLYSPDWDLTGKSNVYVYFNSIYEQNQDSIGAVDYSIDQGKTWLPVLYMIDQADIIKDTSGNIDAYATLSAEQGDTASWLSPTTGEEIGKTYGSFVGSASNTWSTVGAYISGRVNDDPLESKRVEFHRVTQADGQAKVRFRFAQAGTGSWYFGIDNFALYSMTTTTTKAVLSLAGSGGSYTLSWTGTGTLQEATDVKGTWTDSAVQTNPQTITPSGTKFYRVKQ